VCERENKCTHKCVQISSIDGLYRLLLGTRTYYHLVKREPRIGRGLGTSLPTTLIGTTHTHTRMRTYTHTHACVHIHTYTDTYMYTHIQIRTRAHKLYEQVERKKGGVRHGEGHVVHIQHTLTQHTHTHTHTHTHAYTYVPTHASVHIRTHTHRYIHVHTHYSST
jgi:hypothetical protein